MTEEIDSRDIDNNQEDLLPNPTSSWRDNVGEMHRSQYKASEVQYNPIVMRAREADPDYSRTRAKED